MSIGHNHPLRTHQFMINFYLIYIYMVEISINFELFLTAVAMCCGKL